MIRINSELARPMKEINSVFTNQRTENGAPGALQDPQVFACSPESCAIVNQDFTQKLNKPIWLDTI